MTVVQLLTATILPALISGMFTLLEKKTKFAHVGYWKKQILIGVAFGIYAILSSEFGVKITDGTIMNVRDAGPMSAGLIFGAPAGIIAGVIGGLHRWLCVYWGGGMYTRLACSLATLLAGLFGAIMRKRLFDNKKPSMLAGIGLGMTMEVLHMLLVLITNLSDVSYAFTFVDVCAIPMILCNGVSIGLAILASGDIKRIKPLGKRIRMLSYDFGFKIFGCIAIAFVLTSGFVYSIINRVTTEDAELYRRVTVYLTVFMEILIFAALFVLIFQMLKKKIADNLNKVNEGLSEITNGNLDTIINVRTHQEFSDLSDDVNATVSTLKRYIKEAEERIDTELEFARQIQHSALPSVFPPYPNRPDFDLFASIEAAKEVGGDFYDFYLLDRYTLVFLIADVSGKGIPAAMFMMTAKTLIKGLAESGKAVDEVFEIANRKLCESNDAGMFLTAWMAKLDFKTGKLSFVNAGHNPPLICRRGKKFEYLRTRPNFVLAGMETTKYRVLELMLNPGDSIYLYTDGVTEAMDKANALYGEQRLEQYLASADGWNPKQVCDGVNSDIHAFVDAAPQADDITMLAFRLNALQNKDTIRAYPDMPSVPIVSEYLRARMVRFGVSDRAVKRILVAFDEIYSNIVRYSDASFAEINISTEGDELLLSFKDDGKPYDPTQAPAPDITLTADERDSGGLGIHMVRKLTTSMEYKREDDQNKLILAFAR